MARRRKTAKQRAASARNLIKARRKRRYGKKLAKTNRRIKNLERGIARDFHKKSPTYNSPLHRQVLGRKVKRQRQAARYSAKIKGLS